MSKVIEIKIAKSLYSNRALLSTAYWLATHGTVQFAEDDLNFLVKLEGEEDFEKMFLNRLHDEQLRSIIEQETGAIRSLLTAKAFSYGALADEDAPGDLNDPLGMKD